MAMSLSVTVSIAAEMSGMFRGIEFVRRVVVSTSAGRTADSAGIRRTSSKVRASGIPSCAIRYGLRRRYLNDSILAVECGLRGAEIVGNTVEQWLDFDGFA